MPFQSLILDTETHCINGYPIEIAYMPIELGEHGLIQQQQQIFDAYFSLDADCEISFGSMAVHHILPEDIADQPHFQSFRLPTQTRYLIGHNIDYDIQAIARCGQDISQIKGICTLALARQQWPQLDSHALSSLSYFISEDYAKTRQLLKNAHNAKTDILLTGLLLQKLVATLNIDSIEGLYRASQHARLPQHMPFGKHKGMPITQIPIDYLQWLLRQDNLDPYLRQALQQRLN